MHNKTIYIYNPYVGYFAIEQTLTYFQKAFLNNGFDCKIVPSLDGIPKDAVVIPYALDAATEAIKKGYNPEFTFSADAYTLGYINKIKFGLKRFEIFNYNFLYTIHSFLADFRQERIVSNTYKNIIFVSQTDADYIKEKYKTNANCICIVGGANSYACSPKTKSETLRLGILSSWGHRSVAQENGWFINDYFRKYSKRHPNVELHLAGRGKYINDYAEVDNVRLVGAVDNLDDFFKDIDIFISVNPKGCGILNRVLDAFAFKTCVLGYYQSFSGFRYMKDSYVSFDDYNSFEKELDNLIANPSLRESIVNNAYTNIRLHNNWETNMDAFVKSYFLK